MNNPRRLGRGLEALLGRPFDAPPAMADPATPADSPRRVPLHLIDGNPFQPRREFDPKELDELAASLREYGLMQPLVVRAVGERFQLVAGERRLRAALSLGWSEIAVQLVEADDRRMTEMAIVENLQRKDLNAIEKAASFERYLSTYHSTHEELAARLQIDRSTVSNLLRLLELPASVQDAVRGGQISPGHARALLTLGEPREQEAFCQRIQSEGLSVRAVEQAVQEQVREADHEPLAEGDAEPRTVRMPTARNEHLASLEQRFRMALGVKVDLRLGAKRSGRIVIHFKNDTEFERLLEHLAGPQAAGQAA